MKIKRIVSFEESLELSKTKGGAHYWHDSLSADFITKAGRCVDTLKGIDDWVERTSKAEWVEEFRTEQRPEDALAIIVRMSCGCIEAEAQMWRLGPNAAQGDLLPRFSTKSLPRQQTAFRLTQEYHGFTFTDSEKKPIMRIVDSCVRYHPIVYEHDVVPASTRHLGAEQFGKGKSRHPFWGGGGPANNSRGHGA